MVQGGREQHALLKALCEGANFGSLPPMTEMLLPAQQSWKPCT